MELATTLQALDAANPLRKGFHELFERGVRRYYFPRMDFSEPAGDPGWFGPDSATWYVHEHAPLLILGLNAAATIENLHPDFAWMGYDHTRALERDEDGVPTGRLDRKGGAVRRGHSFGFFAAVAYGPTPLAERMCKAVSGMHHRVRGVHRLQGGQCAVRVTAVQLQLRMTQGNRELGLRLTLQSALLAVTGDGAEHHSE